MATVVNTLEEKIRSAVHPSEPISSVRR
jgi:hypothetical protein